MEVGEVGLKGTETRFGETKDVSREIKSRCLGNGGTFVHLVSVIGGGGRRFFFGGGMSSI
jgi:hypothetical protein